MNPYVEVRYLRGDQTVDGILNYLDRLESSINHHLQFKEGETFFGESEGNGTDKYIGKGCFFVPEWLSMGSDIAEWLTYALSFEMTNYYINSRERIEKENARSARIKHLFELRNLPNSDIRDADRTDTAHMNREDRIRIANEKLARRTQAVLTVRDVYKEIELTDCLSSIAKRKKELISFLHSLEEIFENDNRQLDVIFAERLVAAYDRIKSHNQDDFREIDERKGATASVITGMLNETIDYLSENNLSWKGRAKELTQLATEDENRYNIPYMKALFNSFRMTDREMLARQPNNTDNSAVRKPIPGEVRREVWRRDQGQCSRCRSRQNLEYDHIVPISKGGSNTARNIELLCQECNRRKSNSIS